MGSLSKFRKAVGVIKDSTTVSLAKVNSEFKDVDVAIVKATNHVEAPPGERHVRKIFAATSVVRPRVDVAYCIHALTRRLKKTPVIPPEESTPLLRIGGSKMRLVYSKWFHGLSRARCGSYDVFLCFKVALKVLIVIHRTLKEGDPTFREELLNYSNQEQILNIANFKDESSPYAWDCAAWTRTYAMFLEERLECFRILKYDVETERLTRASPNATKVHSSTRFLDSEELLEQLPALQNLLYRLIGCQPEGAACSNYLIQYALALVLKESFKVYCAINDGIINVVDSYFEMPRYDAVKALQIYKRAGQQADMLSDFYEFSRRLELVRNFQFPILRQPPPSFCATMEEYLREGPQIDSVPQRRLEYYGEDESSHKEESQEEVGENNEVEEEKEPEDRQEEPVFKAFVESEPSPLVSTEDDLLGLSQIHPKVAELEENNALALAIVQPGIDPAPSSRALSDLGGTTGWELALVTTPSNNVSHMTESKLAGGFDKLLLDSLYEDETSRRQIELQNAGYGYENRMAMQNPFEQQQDPFAMSNGIAPPTNVQMAMFTQQQHMFQQAQNFQQSQYPQHQTSSFYSSYTNPFGDPFSVPPSNTMPQHGNIGLL